MHWEFNKVINVFQMRFEEFSNSKGNKGDRSKLVLKNMATIWMWEKLFSLRWNFNNFDETSQDDINLIHKANNKNKVELNTKIILKYIK